MHMQSRSQGFIPLTSGQKMRALGASILKCISGFTTQCAVCIYGIYSTCLKWMLPELSFSDRWSRGTKLWERDGCTCGCFVGKLDVKGSGPLGWSLATTVVVVLPLFPTSPRWDASQV